MSMGPVGRAGAENAWNRCSRRIGLFARLVDKQRLVDGEFSVAEKTPAFVIGHDANREDDQVVLGFLDAAVVVDVFVAHQQVAVCLFGDPGDLALDEAHAHGPGLLEELVVALAEGADVDVVDGDVGHRQRPEQELGLLERIHAADARADGIVHGAVARAGAEDVGDIGGSFAVAGAQHVVERPGGGDQAVHLHGGDDVGELAEAEVGHEFGREEAKAGGHDD